MKIKICTKCKQEINAKAKKISLLWIKNKVHQIVNHLYNQLDSEYGDKFTKEEAQYAIENLE